MGKEPSGAPSQGPRTSARAYGIAVLYAGAGLAVTVLATGPLGGWFFMFQFAAVAGAVLQGGLAPGLVAMALSGAGYWALNLRTWTEAHQAWRLASFVLVSVFFALLADRLRRARLRAEAAEAEARAVGAQQERLVAVVSHDLRSPIQAIQLSAERLRRGAGAEAQQRGVARILASAGRMQSMIATLLDFARARHGSGLPVQPVATHLGAICQAALEEVRTARPEHDILLEVNGDDTVAVDPERVEQVACNLVNNAIQHGAAGTPVRVSVSGGPGGVRLAVANQGAPIPPGLLATIFDPFRSGDVRGSVGLGLYIVREIAAAHGGSVSVSSDERETTFAVEFPRRSPGATSAVATA